MIYSGYNAYYIEFWKIENTKNVTYIEEHYKVLRKLINYLIGL